MHKASTNKQQIYSLRYLWVIKFQRQLALDGRDHLRLSRNLLMKKIFVFIDVLSVLFSSGLAVQIGTKYQPNIVVFVITFFAVRTLLQWLYFNSFIHRSLPLTRSIAQFVIILLILPLVLTSVVFVPELTAYLENSLTFYYLIVPAVVLVVSLIFQKFFKIESWQI